MLKAINTANTKKQELRLECCTFVVSDVRSKDIRSILQLKFVSFTQWNFLVTPNSNGPLRMQENFSESQCRVVSNCWFLSTEDHGKPSWGGSEGGVES